MPLFKAQIRKAVNDGGGVYKWSNTWHIEESSLFTAVDVAKEIWEQGERQFHRTYVFCYEVYVASTVEGDDVYTVSPIDPASQSGIFAGSGERLPNFNVVRCDIAVLTPGRPSRKFYRPVLEEGDQMNGALTNVTLRSAFYAGLTYITSALLQVRDESGNTFGAPQVKDITSRRLGKWAGVAVPSQPS